jgi:hypothetical protein
MGYFSKTQTRAALALFLSVLTGKAEAQDIVLKKCPKLLVNLDNGTFQTVQSAAGTANVRCSNSAAALRRRGFIPAGAAVGASGSSKILTGRGEATYQDYLTVTAGNPRTLNIQISNCSVADASNENPSMDFYLNGADSSYKEVKPGVPLNLILTKPGVYSLKLRAYSMPQFRATCDYQIAIQ